MSIIELTNVWKVFKDGNKITNALENVNLQVDEGEFLGLIGPNGAGKSTLVKILSGILKPTRGTVKVMGYTPWVDRRTYVRYIGVFFGQRDNLWWDLPVNRTYSLMKDIYKVTDADFKKTFEVLDNTLNLGEIWDKRVRTLSLGQKIRAAIGTAFIHNPKIVFLDEPTIGLDVQIKQDLRNMLTKLNDELGVTILLTTHDVMDIERTCRRVVFLLDGHIEKEGMLAEIKKAFRETKIIELSYSGDLVLPKNAQVISAKDGWVRLRAKVKSNITNIIHEIGTNTNVIDLSVKDVDLEDIILQIYKGGLNA